MSTLRAQVQPLLPALDSEVVQAGLAIAEETLIKVIGDLDCPSKEAWLGGAHRHMALLSSLHRLASLQSGWTRFDFNNVPYYRIGDDLFLTVKRTPQGRKTARASLPIDPSDFDLLGFDQQTIFPVTASITPAMGNVVVLDYVQRKDGQRLTALLLRRGKKDFTPLCSMLSSKVLRLVPVTNEAIEAAPSFTVRSRIKRAQNQEPR